MRRKRPNAPPLPPPSLPTIAAQTQPREHPLEQWRTAAAAAPSARGRTTSNDMRMCTKGSLQTRLCHRPRAVLRLPLSTCTRSTKRLRSITQPRCCAILGPLPEPTGAPNQAASGPILGPPRRRQHLTHTGSPPRQQRALGGPPGPPGLWRHTQGAAVSHAEKFGQVALALVATRATALGEGARVWGANQVRCQQWRTSAPPLCRCHLTSIETFSDRANAEAPFGHRKMSNAKRPKPIWRP